MLKLLAGTALVAVALLAGSDSGLAQAKKYTFALVPKNMNNPFFDQALAGCRKAEKELAGAVECLYIGPGEHGGGEEQVQVVNDLIAKRVDGIAVSPSNAAAMGRALEAAKQAGIPILTWDSDLLDKDKALRIAYVGTHNYEIGVNLAKLVQKIKPKGGTICIQSGGAAAANHNERMQGIRDTLAGKKSASAPGDKLAGANGWKEADGCPLYTDDDFPRSIQQMEDILGKYPNLDAFVPTGGFPQFLPQAYRKVTEKYKAKIADGSLALVVADTLPVQIELLKAGLSKGQVGQRPFEMGYKAMYFLKDIKDGKPAPTDPTYTGLDVCTPKTADTCVGGGSFARDAGVVEAAGLAVPHPRIGAARGEQLAVAALIDDAALIQHHQPVHARDGREPVRDGNDGASAHQPVELLLDRRLDLGIERRGRFVQDQDRRILEDHPSNRDALALPAGELDAALAHMRVEAAPSLPIFERLDEFQGMGAHRRRAHLLFVRLRPAVADVVADRAVQERGVLSHHGDVGAQALLGHQRNVLPVDQDPAFLRLEEPEQQVDQGRLAGAGLADQADALAGLDLEVDAMDHAALGPVAEAQGLELDPAVPDLEGGGVGPVLHGARDCDRAHAILHGADILEDRGHVLRDPSGDIGDLPGERQRHGHGADGDASLGPQPDRHHAGADHHGRIHGDERQAEQRDQPELPVESVGVLVDRGAHEGVLVPGPGEQLDGDDVGAA